jgi:hypothetical protein
MEKRTQAVATLSGLIGAGKISGAVSMSQIEAAIQGDHPLSDGERTAVRVYLDDRYQVITSNNEAETVMWRVR